jgi:pimeloyl-ACP methyl ester carboxylesterase
MNTLLKSLIVMVLLFSNDNEQVFCQGREVDTEQTKRIAEYLGISSTPTELSYLTELQTEVESQSKPEAERVESFHLLLYQYAKRLNMDTIGLKKSIQSWGASQTVKKNLSVFEDLAYPANPDGKLAEVKKFGTGSIPVILIPEYRKNWSVFNDLIQPNLNQFTFYAITLPGYNGTNPYALPKYYDFSNRVWLDNVVSGVISLIKSERLKKPIIIGALNAGSYIATNVVARLPKNVRGMILLNGSIRDGFNPKTFDLSPEDRVKQVNSSYSNVMWYLLRRYKYSDQELSSMLHKKLSPRHPIYYYTKDTVKVKEVYKMHNAFPSLTERYDLEWSTADLSSQLRQIKVPILVALSNYDANWPFRSKTNHLIAQWKNFKASNQKTNLQITEIPDARLILPLDKPSEVSVILKSFVNEKSLPKQKDSK